MRAVALLALLAAAPATAAPLSFSERTLGGDLAHGAASASRTGLVAPLTLGSAAAPAGSLRARAPVRPVRAPSAANARASTAGASRHPIVVPTLTGAVPRMSSADPGALLLALDTSSSMRLGVGDSQEATRADALADVVNGTFEEWVNHLNVGGVVRDRLRVGAVRYSIHGIEHGLPGWPGAMVSIKHLADNPIAIEDDEDLEGQVVPRPVWMHATHANPGRGWSTPMTGAIQGLRTQYGAWRSGRKATPHLVLAVNVTDGFSTDGDPTGEVRAFGDAVRKNGGSLLMTNIHLSDEGGRPIVFPTDDDYDALDDNGRMLFRNSSLVPPTLALQLGTRPGARMMAFNAGFDELSRVFQAGSSVAAQ